MENFAALDDSLMYKGNRYVYTHALVVNDETPKVIAFFGNKRSIYLHEQEILEFILSNLPEDAKLYACNHYKRYTNIWEQVYSEANDNGLPKLIKLNFQSAHESAKKGAQLLFNSLVSSRAYASPILL